MSSKLTSAERIESAKNNIAKACQGGNQSTEFSALCAAVAQAHALVVIAEWLEKCTPEDV